MRASSRSRPAGSKGTPGTTGMTWNTLSTGWGCWDCWVPAESTMSLIVKQLGKDYPTRSGSLTVLRGIDLELARGDALAVMGPSGSGKSTLLHILGTLEQRSRGSVRLDGQDQFALAEPALADFRNRHIGFVFQDHHLLPQCSVLENVLIPTLVSPEGAAAAEKWARELLDRV